MGTRPTENITQLLQTLQSPGARKDVIRERLYTALYAELQRIASACMSRERTAHTLEPSAVVNEAFLKMIDQAKIQWQDRNHFFAVATKAMRQVLIDHARRRGAGKRGQGWERVTLTGLASARSDATHEILEVEEALSRLAALNPRMAQVVQLRVFGGMTQPEVAEALSVSLRTVADDWAFAKRWLARELSAE